jgi:hypothetical protein
MAQWIHFASTAVNDMGSKLNQSAQNYGTLHAPRMGRSKARFPVPVREILMGLMRDQGYTSRQQLADALGVNVKTLNGMMREKDPRPASTDVQVAIERRFGISARPAVTIPDEAGSVFARGRVRISRYPTMLTALTVSEPIVELALKPGDKLYVEPHSGVLEERKWYVAQIDGEDELVQAVEHKGQMTLRRADSESLIVYDDQRHRVALRAPWGLHGL